MTPGTAVMLLGLFMVPVLLLWSGHRLRRRTPRWRAVFWGLLAGYIAGSVLALVASMVPAAEWSGDDTVRGLLGFWSLVLLPALGAAFGAVRPNPRD
jgi:hypothetical protein